MYILPNKFTGYDAKEIGVENFKSLCYSLQGLGVINVKAISGYTYPKNYYEASVADSDGDFNIYMNCFCHVIAFGNVTDESESYLYKPELVQAVESLCPEIIALSQLELSQEISNENKTNLEAVELKELNYWLPCSVGRVLFSWYFD